MNASNARAIGSPMSIGSLAVTAALTLGCAEPPEVSHPGLDIDLPATWAAGATEARDDSPDAPNDTGGADAPWWTTLGDPGLDAVIARTLERNHDLRAASERVFAAAARASIAGADGLPELGLGAGSTRDKRNFIGFPIPGSSGGVLTTRSTVNQWLLGFDWELDLWGRIRAGHSASLADLQAASADAFAARLSLIGLAAKTWFRAVEARRQLELASATLDNFESTHARIESRFERGLRSSLDVRFSRTNIATAEAAVEARRAEFDRWIRELETITGDYPAGTFPVGTELPGVAGPVPGGLPAELVARRPDLVAAERRLAAAGAQIDAARRALYPRISLTSSIGVSSDELGDLANGNFSVWSLAANLSQPIFQGGRLVAGLDLAKSEHRTLLWNYVGTALNAYREVEIALAAEATLARQEDAARRAADESIEARRLAEDRYDRGLDGLITVLEAQRRAFDSERQWIAVRRQRLENRIDLHLALGGDFAQFQIQAEADDDATQSPGAASASPRFAPVARAASTDDGEPLP